MNKAIMNKDFIDEIKNNPERLSVFMNGQREKNIIYVLNKIGRVENGHIKDPLIALLDKENEKIRELAIKNLAKLEKSSLLNIFLEIAKKDKSTQVRREATSAIGRMRKKEIIPALIYLLEDRDPKIVLQAIRGLIHFKNEEIVSKELKKLMKHPNEIVREIINEELNGDNHQKKKVKQTEAPDYIKNVVVKGDVIKILKNVPKESIHLTFTSPPYYNARDYSIYQSYKEYLNFLKKVFKEVYRVTKEGRFFILNTSPIIIPRVSRKHSSKRYPIPYDIHPLLVKMGWEFIDDIVWVKPEPSVKNRNAGFLQHRKPLAYKPNTITEMLMVYRKKTTKLIDWNIKQYSNNLIEESKVKGKYETTNIWNIDPTFDKVHTAVFPLKLCSRVIEYYSFIGDVVFDPFAGSGTLGKAAIKQKRHFFLTEIKESFAKRIKEEIDKNINIFSAKTKRPQYFNLASFLKKIKGEE